ncbi:MAG: DUF3667 domain-containing protein [Candidatus Marinimicrobia bacterium]|nr:DUF3667 domain-containing protein [Candidatus Neomarinimicrobiota bacterium]MCF7922458.1 DUF3667 domain-containing protein [Candidatus Neomarinimicrobiota bacterium]
MSKQKPRIASAKQCLNCGSDLSAEFCPKCGQKNKDYSLTFKDLFSDFLEELLDVDSRVLRSLRLLFTRPGFLTSEYVKGRRVSYVPPVRLYLVASVLFFLALSLKTLLPNVQNNEFFKELSVTGDIDNALENALESRNKSLTADDPITERSGLVPVTPDSSDSGMTVSIGDGQFDVNQGDFLSNFSDNFAKMMFLLLPVAALQLKALYWRRKKLYIEHLVFSLHVHAFIFSILILTVILDFKLTMWLVIVASLVYLFIAMKNYYGQSISKTASKMILLLSSYGLTILIVMTLTLVVTAASLVLGNSG